MEGWQLLLEYTKALVWPVVTLVLVMQFKKPLEGLLVRLKKADLPGDISFDFTEEIEQAQQLSIEVEKKVAKSQTTESPALLKRGEANKRMISLGLQPSPSGLDMGYYRSLVMQEPRIALAGLRVELEIIARNLAKGFNVAVSDKDTGLGLIRKLYENGAISKEQMKLAQKIFGLCNAAIHGAPVAAREAEQILDLAEVSARDYLRWLSWGFQDGWMPKELKNE